MKEKRAFIFCIIVSLILLFSSTSFANVVFKITADSSTIPLGQPAILSIWANVEEETTGLNGINVWQLDMVVNTGGIVSATNVDLIAPTPMDAGSGGSMTLDTDLTGNVYEMGASTTGVADSNTGVVDFSLVAEVTIEAIGVGTVEYRLVDRLGGGSGFYAILRDGEYYDAVLDPPEKAVSENEFYAFTVEVPEPISLLLFGGMAITLRRRKLLRKN